MGLLRWFRNQKVKKVLQETDEELKTLVQSELIKPRIDFSDKGQRISYLKENCEQIIEISKQSQEYLKEYELVTAYLTDIQIIDGIPLESRLEVNEAAKKVLTLTRERQKYQNYNKKITDKQYQLLLSLADTIPNEVRRLNEKESYVLLLEKDIKLLRKEGDSLSGQLDDIQNKQGYLRKLALTICGLTVTIFALLMALAYSVELDYTLPFVITIVVAMAGAGYILYEDLNSKKKAVMLQRKMNRAVALLNRTNIKYVNNKCSLDYTYSKFNIKKSKELTELWNEFMAVREIEKSYQKNTDQLAMYQELLVKLLHNYHIKDANIWIHQSIALIDPKEMVEIRHSLNVRRQKLRDRMEYNQKTSIQCIENIKNLLREWPESKEEVVAVLNQYGIQVD